MNYFIIAVLLLMSTGLCSMEYTFVKSSNGEEVSLKELTSKLVKDDVVFFGELHDDSLLHHLEATLFEAMADKNKRVVLSMEMFETDNQEALTKYVRGEYSEEEFKANVRLWPNHYPDYEPLLQIAKRYKRDVIAANVPRRYAGRIVREGEDYIETLPADERKLLARKLVVLDDDYKTKFFATMSGMGGKRKMAMQGDDMVMKIYKAQCLKDDTMAESIYDYMKENKKAKVLHINGDFHSSNHLGTAQKVALLNPKLDISVITPVPFEVGSKLEWDSSLTPLGDYLILFERVEKE
ncbi:MAG: hypothetical protein B6226_04505 [Candidatus Cloacimonetes bacterium 4572_65]|nr:MAG: hypothetical protein B6226_04505 [Candidatus Cloacimonetes bacterium 4572_65]